MRHRCLPFSSAALTAFLASMPPVLAADYSNVAVPGMNTQVAPGDDFYRFVNGGWDAATEIPAGHTGWSVLAQLSEDNFKKMATAYQDAAKGAPGTSAAAKRVGDYYTAQT